MRGTVVVTVEQRSGETTRTIRFVPDRGARTS
jgi:hypothetical protein